MKYDLTHVYGCGATYVSRDLGDDHERGENIKIKCARCGVVGDHEVRGRLEGLA